MEEEEEEEEEDQEVTVSFSRYEQAAYVAARASLIQTGAPPLVSNDLWDGVDPVSMAMDELSLEFLDPSLKIIRTMPDGSIQEVTPVHDPASGDMWMEEYRSNSLANSCTRGSSYYKHTAAGTAYKAIVEEMVQSLCLPSDEAALILEAFAEPAAKEDEDTDHPCPDEPVMMANCALQTLKPWVPEDTAFQESIEQYDPESNYLLSDVAQDASDARDESTAEKAEQDGSLPDWGTPSQVTQSQVTQSQVTQSQVTQSQVTSLLTYTKESIIQSILHKGGCHSLTWDVTWKLPCPSGTGSVPSGRGRTTCYMPSAALTVQAPVDASGSNRLTRTPVRLSSSFPTCAQVEWPS